MTVDDQPPPAPAGVDPAPPGADPAVERYLAAMRRPRMIYAGTVVAVVLALVAFVVIEWAHSEVAHTTLHTVANPPTAVALQTPSTTLRLAWQSTDATAIGTPFWQGTVITYSRDSVHGRNALTGAITWSYTRTDRTVCQAIQDQGTTIAIFELAGNCNEVTGLDSSTGQRKWTRTLDENGYPIEGHPSYAVGPFTIMAVTPSVIYAFDPGSGLDRWMFAQKTCTISSAVLGSAGALISQSCAHPDCTGLTYCGNGPQLVLRDPTAGQSSDSAQKANPDQIKWILVGNGDVPVSADQFVSAADPGNGQLAVLNVTNGRTQALLPLPAGTNALGAAATQAAQDELLWIGGVSYAINLAATRYDWHTATPAALTLTQIPGQPSTSTLPQLSGSWLAVPEGAAVVLLDGSTGAVARTYPISTAPPASQAFPFGTGFVVAGSATAVYQ